MSAYEQASASELSGRELRELLTDALKAAATDGLVCVSGWRVALAHAWREDGEVKSSVDVVPLVGWMRDESGDRVACWEEDGYLVTHDAGTGGAIRVIEPAGRGFDRMMAEELKRTAEQRLAQYEAAVARRAAKGASAR